MNTQETPQATIKVVKDFFAEYTEEQLSLAEHLESLGLVDGCGEDYLDDLDDEDITCVDDFDDYLCGYYESDAEFAKEYCGEVSGDTDNIPAYIVNHVDWQAVWDCELHHEFRSVRNIYFRR